MDKWFGQPLIVTSLPNGESYIDFNEEILDFSEGYEVALVEAHVDLKRPDSKEDIHLHISSRLKGEINMILGAHVVRSADDFMQVMGVATFIHNGTYVPVTQILMVRKVGPDRVKFSLRNQRDHVSITFKNDYTRHKMALVGPTASAVLTKFSPSRTCDLSKLRDPVTSLDVYLPGFVDRHHSMSDLLDTIPLTGEKNYFNIHYEPKTLVYKPVTCASFSKIPIKWHFYSDKSEDDGCSRLQQGTLILHLRKKQS